MSDHDRTSTYDGHADPASSSRWARLCVVHPPEVAGVHVLPAGPCTLGRDAGASVVVQHRTVSRRHIELRREGASVTGHDLGSHNGTWFNGVPAAGVPRSLRDGDVVRLGEVVAVLELGTGTPPTDADAHNQAVPGFSAAAHELRARIGQVAADPAPVLLIGESGTGKEAVARELHLRSGRGGQLIVTNCAALAPSLIESQLFGHEKGAFTGAVAAQAGLFRAADGGSLFLDEVGEIPLPVQPKLLRAVELGEVAPLGGARTQTVDTRIIAATNRDLAAEVEAGNFRRDLYARLSLFEVRLPTLAERRPDIPMWVQRLQQRWGEKRDATDHATPELAAETVEAILLHDWPTNLRGIDQLVHELATQEHAAVVTPSRLPAWIENAPEAPPPKLAKPSRDALLQCLEKQAWNIAAVATHFGRDRKQIYRWIEAYGIALKR